MTNETGRQLILKTISINEYLLIILKIFLNTFSLAMNFYENKNCEISPSEPVILPKSNQRSEL